MHPGPHPIPWQPLFATTGQVDVLDENGAPAPPTPAQEKRLLDQIGEGFRAVTPALILTGLFIGLASGAGSTVGNAVGTIIVDRFMPSKKRRGRSRA